MASDDSRSVVGSGIGPVAKRTFVRSGVPKAGSQPFQDGVLQQVELVRPGGGRSRDMERSVPRDPQRPRVAGHGVADDLGPRGGELAEWDRVSTPAPGELVSESGRRCAPSARHRPGVTDERERRLTRQRLRGSRGHDRLGRPGDHLASASRRRPVELGEHVVEEHERRHAEALAEQLGLGEHERQHRHALLALRAVDAKVASSSLDPQVVEVGTGAGEATFDVGSRRPSSSATVAPCLRSPSARVGEAEAAGSSVNAASEQVGGLGPRDDELVTECTTRSVHGASASRVE